MLKFEYITHPQDVAQVPPVPQVPVPPPAPPRSAACRSQSVPPVPVVPVTRTREVRRFWGTFFPEPVVEMDGVCVCVRVLCVCAVPVVG